MAELGVEVLTGAKAKGLPPKKDALLVETADGKEVSLPADKILVTVGRKPLTEGWGIEELALDMAGKFIRIDDQCRTSMRGVYAIGDVTGEPMLAHRAMAQGEMVAEIVAGRKRSWDKRAIPAICFTDPEVVSVGLSPEEARALGREVKTGLFPFQANGRAMTMLGEEGFVRVIARADNHLVLGIQAVGQGVSELSRRLLAGHRDGRAAGGHRRHHPRAPDQERGVPGSGDEGARPRAAYLTGPSWTSAGHERMLAPVTPERRLCAACRPFEAPLPRPKSRRLPRQAIGRLPLERDELRLSR